MKHVLTYVILIAVALAAYWATVQAVQVGPDPKPEFALAEARPQQSVAREVVRQDGERVEVANGQSSEVAKPESSSGKGGMAERPAPEQSLASQLANWTDPDRVADQLPSMVPATPEQRRAILEVFASTVEAQMVDLCNEIAETDRADVAKVLGQAAGEEIELALVRVRDGELGYRIELHEAIRNEFLTGDLASTVKPSRDRPGILGSVSTACEKSSVWKRGGNVKATYFLDFSKYPALAAAEQSKIGARRRLEELVESLRIKLEHR